MKAALVSAMWVLVTSVCEAAGSPEFVVTLQNHQFSPPELIVPARQKVKLIVKNLDPTAAEFESYELVREKVVEGRSEIVVYIGPLAPGSYHYYDDLHHDAKGVITSK